MGLNVGVSLWVDPAPGPRGTASGAPEQDFARQVGLHDSPARPQAGRQQGLPVQLVAGHREVLATLGITQLSQVLRSESQVFYQAPAAQVLELYALGAQAGHHLSYVPQVFLWDWQEPSSVQIRGQGIGLVPESGALEGQSQTPTTAFAGSTAGGPADAEAWPSDAADEQIPVIRQLIGYLSTRWQDRRCQLLPREQGVELLIRDYHLSAEERASLIDDLSRQLAQISERPLRIWLNGEPVWQAAPVGHSSQGDSHGR